MKRRDFLTLCGLAAGSVLIPKSIARLIRDTCVLAGRPLVLPRHFKAGSIIYAVHQYGDYTLHFGDPDAEPPVPTWQEFLDSRGVDLDSDEERFEILERYFHWTRSVGEPEPDIPLDDPIDGGALEFYLDWDYDLRESPKAQVFHYLNNLPLCPGGDGIADDPLGELDFIEGDRPGSNLTYVQAPNLASLACLQHRLNELDEDIQIEIL